MNQKKDIQTRADIVLLLDTFYAKATIDPEIGYFFTEIANLDLKAHMPKMYSFWSQILLGENTYNGNVMEKHFQLHAKSPLLSKHFDRWISLWKATVEDMFEGEKAEEAKNRAASIAGIMQHKIENISPKE